MYSRAVNIIIFYCFLPIHEFDLRLVTKWKH